MIVRVLKAVVCGAMIGALAFFVPHFLIGIMLLFLIVRMFHCCGCHGYRRHGHKMKHLFVMADLIRKMNDEEYAEFKANMSDDDCCGHHSHCCGGRCCGSKSNKECCETKKEEAK